MPKVDIPRISDAAFHELVKDAKHVASFKLSGLREAELDVPGGRISLARLKDKDADYIATLRGSRPSDNILLGYGDDLEKMIEACSALATQELETLPDGTSVLVHAPELVARFDALKPAFGPIALTAAQVACAETYANGEFAYVVEIARSDVRLYDKELAGCGDPLFRFLMRELDAREDCETQEDAADRLDTVARDVLAVKFAIEDLPAPKP